MRQTFARLAATIVALAAMVLSVSVALNALAVIFPSNRSGDFELTLTTDAAEYQAGQPISAFAKLSYLGQADSAQVTGLGDVIAFGLRQLDGPIRADGNASRTLACSEATILRDQPLIETYGKTAAWSGGDPNAEWYRTYLANPDLVLTKGRWLLLADVDGGYDGLHCQGQFRLHAETQIVVN